MKGVSKNQILNTGLLLVISLVLFNPACSAATATAAGTGGRWQIGTPVTTYYAGPPINEATAKQMADGGFNLICCTEKELDTANECGLRAQLMDAELLSPQTMSNPAQLAKLDALIERVKSHPAMYSYNIIDEPDASLFPALGKLVAHLRKRDPAHLAYINLLPTYADNKQLGTKGDTVTAYREHLRLFIQQVKPDLLSYDHYHFTSSGKDNDQYFLNLAMIRQTAIDAGIPFMNIVQACTWESDMRAPNGDEMRWLNYTSLAYGAQALSYFVYCYAPFYKERTAAGVDAGGMMRPSNNLCRIDGPTTTQYAAAKELNPQFIAIASQLQPLRSIGAYHVGTVPKGAVALPNKARFYLDFSGKDMSKMPAEGMLLGYFGKTERSTPTHVLVVNLNYKNTVTTTVVGPDRKELFDTATRQWTRVPGPRTAITLPPGGGKLIRVQW